MSMNSKHLNKILHDSLSEDLPNGDITTEMMLSSNQETTAKLISKDNGIFFGEEILSHIFPLVEETSSIHLFKHNSDIIKANETIAVIKASVKTILKVERVMLNFLQRLSGIATTTHAYVTQLNNPKIKVVDTRKTTPLLRFLEKEAVLSGGGYNHRQSLSDMVLVKENHLSQLAKENRINGLESNIQSFKLKHPKTKIEIEIESISQLKTLPLKEVDIIMFDNFSISDLQEAVAYCKKHNFKNELEVSGNITIDNIHHYKDISIDRIAVGSLTHSAKAIDLSLLLQ